MKNLSERHKIEVEVDNLKEYISLQVKAINQNLTEKQQQRKHFDLATKVSFRLEF